MWSIFGRCHEVPENDIEGKIGDRRPLDAGLGLMPAALPVPHRPR